MRQILLMRGPPGAGKTTLLNELGLSPFALSLDALRSFVAAPVLNRDGAFVVSQDHNDRVFALCRGFVEERMQRGELIVLDTTAQANDDLHGWLEMARRYRYRPLLVDLSTVPLERIKAQNAQRPDHQRVSDFVVERALTRIRQQPPIKNLPAVQWDDQGGHRERIRAFLDVPVRDLSAYREVVHVGDLQGCLSPLTGPGGVLEHGLKDDAFYVFVGDLVDRGPENAAVVRWMLDHAVGRPNVALLYGNHEKHLERYAQGLAPVSQEFRERTLPQLQEAGLRPEDVEPLVAQLLEAFPYTYREHRVLVTHAGLPIVPVHLSAVSLEQLSHGTGEWSDPVDAQFDRLAADGWTQVHGHRNHGHQAIHASVRSFNLEGGVEHGGFLRAAILSEDGWRTHEIRNRRFVPYRQRLHRPETLRDAPAWMHEPAATFLAPEVLTAMRAHPGVREKTSARAPHVASLNFTKQVFFEQDWDDVVVKARGLFFDAETGEIAARSYEKFFNINERPETQMAALGQSLTWPITAYVKENGYLGLIGIDPRTQDLFLASKSTPDGDFADWFRDIFHTNVLPGTQEALRRWLVDNEASLAVEVIDPVRDPHMIAYDRPHLVVLDVFHRTTQVEKLPHGDLVRWCKRFGLTPKERGMEFRSFDAFSGWYKAATRDLTYRHRGRYVEGYVIEDAAGFQTKVKMPHYAFWKRMRGAKDRLIRLKTKETDARAALEARLARGDGATRERQEVDRFVRERAALLVRDPHPLAQAFLAWADRQPLERLASNIIALRDAMANESAVDPAWMQIPWAAFDPSEGEGQPAPERRRPRP